MPSLTTGVSRVTVQRPQGEAERTQALETQLKEKRDVISKLEEYIERHVNTLAELRQSVANLKVKSASRNSPDPSSESIITVAIPGLTEEEQAPESAEEVSGELADGTVAMNMCKALSEAQRVARSPEGLFTEPRSAVNRAKIR